MSSPKFCSEMSSPKFCSQADYKYRAAAVAEYPDAHEVIKVVGGWMVFFSADDAERWHRQK